jgi:hypothetical protein
MFLGVFGCAYIKNENKKLKKYYFDAFSIEKHSVPHYQTHSKSLGSCVHMLCFSFSFC